jgi:hypothetical protein
MAPEYRIDIKDTTGARQAVITDFLWLDYRKARRSAGLARFGLGGSHAALGLLLDKYQVEIWRRDAEAEIDWYCDFYGLFRDDEAQDDDNGRTEVALSCPEQKSMLGWRMNAFPAGTASRTAFSSVAAETIMKTLVSYNCTSLATTGNGRDRNGQISGISVQTDAAGGNILSWESARGNLLNELAELAQIGGLDFDLIKTGGATWEFRTYVGQRGIDRSGTVTFAQEYGNMRRPKLTRTRSTERTVAIIAGQGQSSDRRIRTRTGANYNSTNDIEMLVDARQGTTDAALDAAGDRALEDKESRARLEFQVIQTPATLYGKHYCVSGDIGDLVRGRYRGVEATKVVESGTVQFKDGKEIIAVETSDP